MRKTARRAATRDGGRDTRMIVVVDDDTDITNINEVLWAVASRVLASDRARQIIGAVFFVDGGTTAGRSRLG
jgi:UbiD family decarboxylase